MSTQTTNFALVKPGSSDPVTPVGGAPSDLNANADTIDAELSTGHHWSPADSGYLAWTGDPGAYMNNTIALTSHTYILSALRCHKKATFAKLGVVVTTAGTRTDVRFAVYDATGARLATTGNITGSIAGAGFVALPFLAAGSASPGVLYVVGWEIASAAMSLTASTVSQAGAGVAVNDPTGGSAVRRSGSVSDGGSGTDVPASLTVSGGVVTSPAFVNASMVTQFWCGLIP